MSSEHIFPRWLQKHLGIKKIGFQSTYNRSTFTGALSSLPGTYKIYSNVDQKRTFSGLVNGNVCEICNNRWMSVLENKAKALLVGLISKQKNLLGLSEGQRQLLAHWTIKTLYAFNSAYAMSVPVPESHHRQASSKDHFLAPNTAVFAAQIDPRGTEYESRFSADWPLHSGTSLLGEIDRIQAKSYKLSLQLRALHLMVAHSGDFNLSFVPVSRSHVLIHSSDAKVLEGVPALTVPAPAHIPRESPHQMFHWRLGLSGNVALNSESNC
jgi:hypothetical protein